MVVVAAGLERLETWKQLLLEDPDPAVRREMCTGVYRLCLGTSSHGRTGAGMIAPLLAILLQYFELAQTMKPPETTEASERQLIVVPLLTCRFAGPLPVPWYRTSPMLR